MQPTVIQTLCTGEAPAERLYCLWLLGTRSGALPGLCEERVRLLVWLWVLTKVETAH